MPAYNFKERFAAYVAEGSKRQTVRAFRKGKAGHAKPGEPVYLFSGMRTRNCVRLGEARCTKTDVIRISKYGIELFYQGGWKQLDERDRDLFAWNDGFRYTGGASIGFTGCWDLMFRYWFKENGLPWEGMVVYWDNFVASPVKIQPAAE